MSADTNARIENILVMIQTLQNGATNVIKAIENQKSCNDDILREFANTQQMFQKLNTTIMIIFMMLKKSMFNYLKVFKEQ